jgi:hypothetical protein
MAEPAGGAGQEGLRGLIIDLSGTPFVASAVFGALIAGICRMRELGGEVGLACICPASPASWTTGDRTVSIAAGVQEAESRCSVSRRWIPPIR